MSHLAHSAFCPDYVYDRGRETHSYLNEFTIVFRGRLGNRASMTFRAVNLLGALRQFYPHVDAKDHGWDIIGWSRRCHISRGAVSRLK